ncbi:D-2-hydroxyacid dehydrogenase [Dyadobacter helix]|nr:D-2-hydroxyacid dehydrogenase [Dyadobacter sp. CECT 9275]
MIVYCHSIFDDLLRQRLSEAIPSEYQIFFRTESDTENQQNFEKANLILGNPPIAWFNKPHDNLVFWQLDSAGFDQYSGVVLSNDTKVANMGDWFARPCAESIIGGVLALYRGLDKLTLLKQKPEWIGTPLRQNLKIIYKQNVVILGAGTIGQAVNEILKGLGCNIHIMARTSPMATLHSREELLRELSNFDLVINTLPGTAYHFADDEFFAAMKKSSVYASVGRGSTTDESTLTEALRSGHLDGAVLDVTETEPLPYESPLWQMENVILTQHTGGGHKNEHMGKVDLFLNNIFALESGAEIIDQITLSKGY